MSMGDHRASIKIEMTFHGVEKKCDMWINYWPKACCGMDARVIEFFEHAYEKGMEVYENKMADYRAEQEKASNERREREELTRLKEKYEERP